MSVGAVVLLDEDCCSTTLLELPLLMETPETTLDQDGCQGHPLIKCILLVSLIAALNHCCNLFALFLNGTLVFSEGVQSIPDGLIQLSLLCFSHC